MRPYAFRPEAFSRSKVLRLLGGKAPPGTRAVIYARVSSAKQAGAGNLERQKKRLEEYCRDKGHQVVASIAEQGSRLNEKRKAWPGFSAWPAKERWTWW